MKEESVINVLIYLFQNHLSKRSGLDQDTSYITHILEKAGFTPAVIDEAIHWLEKLLKENVPLAHAPQTLSTRVFSPEEQEVLDIECLGFMLALEQQAILTPEMREIVINQVLALEVEFIDITLLKWIVLMVLCNQSNDIDIRDCIEFFMLENTADGIH